MAGDRIDSKGPMINQSCLCNETCIEIQKERVQRASRLVRFGGEQCALRGHGSSGTFTPSSQMQLLHLADTE